MFRASVLSVFVGAAAASAASPDPKSLAVSEADLTRTRALVAQLGSESYRERELANRELAKFGRLALPALNEALRDNPDAEVRMRSQTLLPRASADDLRAKVEVFLADTESKHDHDLPGWNEYRTIVGTDKLSRELFGEVLKNGETFDLLLATAGPPEKLQQMLKERRTQMFQRIHPTFRTAGFQPRRPNLSEVAAIVLAESIAPEKEDVFFGGMIYQTSQFFYEQGDVQSAARGQGKYGAPFRKLTMRWLETRDGVNGINQALNVAQNLGFPQSDILKIHVRMLSVEGQGQQWQRAQALGTIAQTKRKDLVPAVVKTFEDSAMLTQNGPGNPVPDMQVRDLGLAVAIYMTGQDMKDYGLTIRPGMGVAPQVFFNYHAGSVHFSDDAKTKADDKRTAAFKKWKEWEAKNPLDKKDEKPKVEAPKVEKPTPTPPPAPDTPLPRNR